MVSVTPYSLKSVSLERLPLWELWAEGTFQGQARHEEPLIVQVQLSGGTMPQEIMKRVGGHPGVPN